MQVKDKKILIDGVEFNYDETKAYEKDGNVYCNVCNEQINGEAMEFLSSKMMFRRSCACDRKLEEKRKERERQNEIARLKQECFNSIISTSYTFDNFKGSKTKLYIVAKNFVKEYEMMKKENIGLIFYGNVGSGKTYLACAIANALIEKHLIRIKMKNFAEIINNLQKGFEFDKNEYINSIVNTELLILDDLGIERDTSYAKEQVYNIINNRYQKHKPTIITTNLPYDTLFDNTQGIEYQRIYSRVQEMCIPVLVVGEDFRKEIQKEKLGKVKNKLLGGDGR